MQGPYPENALESVALKEMRTAAAQALMRKEECAAKQFIIGLIDGSGDLDLLTDGGRTLLMIAVVSDSRAIVKLLLERRAAVNAEGDDGRSALHNAARRGDVDVMRDLLEARADPHMSANDGFTPSSDARWYAPPEKHAAVRKVLRDYGFEEYACEVKLWDARRRQDSNETVWRRGLDQELMPMI